MLSDQFEAQKTKVLMSYTIDGFCLDKLPRSIDLRHWPSTCGLFDNVVPSEAQGSWDVFVSRLLWVIRQKSCFLVGISPSIDGVFGVPSPVVSALCFLYFWKVQSLGVLVS